MRLIKTREFTAEKKKTNIQIISARAPGLTKL